MAAVTKGFDLDKVVEEFSRWHMLHEELIHQKENLESELCMLQKQYDLSRERRAATMKDFHQAQEMVSSLQTMLKLKCDLEDENMQLKDKVTNVMDELAAVREEHKHSLNEAEEKMNKLKATHKQETEKLQEKAAAEKEKEVGILKGSLQRKMCELSQLYKQLAELEKEKNGELARLGLEYDAKLLKLQKEMSRAQQQTTKTANKGSDIFRQKLLNVRSEADREVVTLKRTISELQRKLDVRTGGTYGPKRKY